MAADYVASTLRRCAHRPMCMGLDVAGGTTPTGHEGLMLHTVVGAEVGHWVPFIGIAPL